jgi:hypothetical protein
MAKYVYGVTSIEMGPIASDGGMGTSLVDVGQIEEKTCTIEQADTTIVEKRSEQSDDPYLRLKKRGVKTLKFTIVDFTPANLIKFLGGEETVEGSDPAWDDGDVVEDIERSVKVTTKNGIIFHIIRGDITAKIVGSLTSDDNLKVEVTCVALKPTKANTKSFRIITPAA